jgi:hypothetical protein
VIRRLLVWLVVIVTALAAGIALGGGPLSDIGRTPSQAAPAPEQRTDPLVEARADFADSFTDASAEELYDGGLEGRSVAVLTLPGADADTVEELASGVEAAGGEVTGRYALKGRLVDAGEKSLVDTLGAQVVEQLGSEVVTADVTTYDRMGQLIGRSVAVRGKKSVLPSGTVDSLRASLDGAGLIAMPEGETAPASLVLVVAGQGVEQPVIAGLVTGFAATSLGVVVAGPIGDATISALRAESLTRPVTTVDGTETAGGRVATILALVHSLGGTGGSFGASGSDGVAPLG